MPHLRILTNKSLSEYKTEETIKKASSIVAEMLQKDESSVMVTIQDKEKMTFGGTTDYTAYLHLESIGFKESPNTLAGKLCDFAEQQMGISQDRVYVNFEDLNRELYGWNGKTFG